MPGQPEISSRNSLARFRQYVEWLEDTLQQDPQSPPAQPPESRMGNDSVDRWDVPEPANAMGPPTAHVSFAPVEEPAPTLDREKPLVELPTPTEQLVAKISAAIAAALQNGDEHQLEQQAQDYLRERGRPAPVTLATNPSGQWNQQLSPEAEDVLVEELLRQRTTAPAAPARPPSQTPNPQAPPATDLAPESDALIPLEVAAWDVEDFRWPVVTNQLIVSADQALQSLLQTAVGTGNNDGNGARRLAISSVQRTQGATSIGISLARWSAAQGLRTLLVDADVACPSLSSRVGMDSNLSWLNGINRDLPIAELIIRSRKSNLCVMPLASKVSRVIWPRFIFDCLGQLLEPVQQQFDLILIDAGSASQLLDELSQPGHLIDGLLLINDGDLKSLNTTQRRLLTFGIEHLVLVENRRSGAIEQAA